MNDGRPLKKCPSCRKPIEKPKNVVNDLTMIDYMERENQKRRETEQEDLKEQLRFLQEAISTELQMTESHLDERTNLDLTEKMKELAAYARCIFNDTLLHMGKNEAIMSKMTSITTEPLHDRIRGLHEQRMLMTSLLEKSYIISQEVFDRCRSETDGIIQSKPTLADDQNGNMWRVYRDFLLDQYSYASRQWPTPGDTGTCTDVSGPAYHLQYRSFRRRF